MRYFLAVAFLLVPSLLTGTTFDTIIRSTEETSVQAEQARLRYESGLISIEQAEIEDGTSYSVSMAVSPLENRSRIISVSDLSFTATLPDDDTSITASIPFSISYDGSGALVSPSASVSHVFDWGLDDDNLKTLQNASSRISVDREYSSDLLSLRMSVINAVSQLLSNEKSLLEEEEALRDLQREMESALRLGLMNESSLSYMEAMLSIRRSEDRIDILNMEKDELAERYRNLTGLEWDGVEAIPDPVFPDLSVSVSSALEAADLYARIAEEQYQLELSRQNPRRLTIGAAAGGNAYLGDDLGKAGIEAGNSISVSGEAGWEGREWSFGISGGGTWDEDYSFYPELTISGRWRNNTASKSDELTLRTLQNESIMRRSEYLDQKRSFEEESNDLWGRVISWKRSWAELEAETEYSNAMLENARIRLERGLARQEDLHDAQHEVMLLDYDRNILLLEGLSLEAEIAMHIL